MITVNQLCQFHLEHRDGRKARVLALSLDTACRALEWYNADAKLMMVQPVEAYVLEQERRAEKVSVASVS